MALPGVFGFKVLFKRVFGLLSKKSGRKFLLLSLRHGERQRFTAGSASVEGIKLSYVDNMSFLWQFHDIFVKEVYKFHSKIDDPLIIDCGSNIGLSIIYLKKQYPGAQIIGFEADPDIYKVQKENVESFERVETRHEAVWVDDKGIRLFRNKADGAYVSDEGDVQVPSIRLRDFLRSFEKIDLLKMDVEGAEFDLIRDCKDELHRVDKLFVEIHTFAGQKQELSELISTIEATGFRYFIENANDQISPMTGHWKTSDTGMDMQLNLYAIRE